MDRSINLGDLGTFQMEFNLAAIMDFERKTNQSLLAGLDFDKLNTEQMLTLALCAIKQRNKGVEFTVDEIGAELKTPDLQKIMRVFAYDQGVDMDKAENESEVGAEGDEEKE